MTDYQQFLDAAAARRQAIAAEYRAGATQAELAERHGVRKARIQQILTAEGVPSRRRGRRPKPATA